MRGEPGDAPFTIALGGTLLSRSRHHAPWQLEIDPRDSAIVIVRQGACELHGPSAETLALAEGDLVLMLGAVARLAAGKAPGRERGGADVLSSCAASAAQAAPRVTELLRVEYAGSTALVSGLAGRVRPVVHLRAANDGSSSEVASMVRFIDAEIDRVAEGRHALLGRLLESLFVYAARAALGGAVSAPLQGIGGVSDALIAKALDLVHANPAARWTVERLAKATGLSRAAFARRFLAATGIAPLQYVTERRMQLSERLLVETDESLAAIAARVGYESEFAFSRAFKRHREVAPGAFRRARRALSHRPLPATTRTRAAA